VTSKGKEPAPTLAIAPPPGSTPRADTADEPEYTAAQQRAIDSAAAAVRSEVGGSAAKQVAAASRSEHLLEASTSLP